MNIQAIETSYKGYMFRSRLEARWAVFFDALDFLWRYEPEGFDLDELGWYLPDFLAVPPGIGPSWIEIKPFLFTEGKNKPEFALNVSETLNRFTKLIHVQITDLPYQHYCGLILAGPPGEKTISGLISVPMFLRDDRTPVIGKSMTAAVSFAVCPSCGRVCCLGMGDKESGHNVICTCLIKDGQQAKMTLKDKYLEKYVRAPQLMAAYDAARSARFEHGETPKVKRGRQSR
jgi:hypothetical protein